MNNREVTVRSKQASDTKKAVDLVPTKKGCNIRDEFGTVNKSFEQQTYTYTLNGVTNQVGQCFDTGKVYPHYKAYTDAANKALCNPVTDAKGRPVSLQSRVAIDVDGVTQYRTPCAPDTSAPGITATTSLCDNPALWTTHDIKAGQSYGMERFVFMNGGKEVKLTDCQKSSVVYPHAYETVGWERNDAKLNALPKTTVYITPPTGRYDIVVGQVLSGAIQQPYQLTGTSEDSTGVPDYPDNSCTKYILTKKYENWKRPDKTIFQKPIGTGTPINAGYDCTGRGALLAKDWTLSDHTQFSYSYSRGSCWNSGNTSGHYQYITGYVKYQATRELVRGDGKVISTETKTAPTTFNAGTKNLGGPLGAQCATTKCGSWGWTSSTSLRYPDSNCSSRSASFSPSTNPPSGTDIGSLKASAGFQY